MKVVINDPSTGTADVSASSWPIGDWNHLVLTRSGSSLTLYRDGSSVGTGTDGATLGFGICDLFIGTDSDSGESCTGSLGDWFDGGIDEFAVWSDDLTSTEVTALYNSGTPLSAASDSGNYASSNDLVAYYKMDDGSGSSVTDSSTNSNSATLTNMDSSDWNAFSVTQSKTTQSVTEGGSADTYTLVLDQEPSADVTVTLTSSDTGAATVTSSLTFTKNNWNTAQTVTVTHVDDADSSDESVTISHSLSGGGYTGVSVTDVTVTVTDDDSADSTGPTMTIASVEVSDGAISEDATLSMTFTSNEATSNFVVGDITVGNGTLSNFSGSGTTYTATLTPTAEGGVTVDVAAGVFTDSASNDNDAATQFNWTYLSSPISKKDVKASIKAMSGVAIDAVQMNFNAVEHRINWLHANIHSNKLSHQGIAFKFANPMVDKLMNTTYVKPGKFDPTNELLKLLRNNIKDGDAPELVDMTDDTKQGLNNAAFNEIAKVRENTIDRVLKATGGSVMGDWNVWTEGKITVGKTYSTSTTSEQDSETQNISLGFDKIIKDEEHPELDGHLVGVVIGIGKSDADTTNSSTVDADSYSISGYGLLRQEGKTMVEAMVGYGHIDVDKTRKDGSYTLTGSHTAEQMFGSLVVKKETMRLGSFSLSPYGKIYNSRTWYDGYAETGGATALTYGKQVIDSNVLSAGLDVDYMIPINNGNIRPLANFEYGADVSGSSTVVMHYNNETTNYQLELDNKADSNWKFQLGSDFYTEDEWDSSIRYERTEAVNAGYSDSLAVKVRLNF